MDENKYMYSIGFPNIFNGSTIHLNKDFAAVKSNLRNLLGSDKGGLYGDPNFGTALKPIIYDQAAQPILKDLIIDEVFESIYSYMPQITVKREDIDIKIEKNIVSVSINVSNNPGVTSDMLKIDLLMDENK